MTPARRRTDSRIPADLVGPVEVALARSVEQIPEPHALPGGCRYEVKWDGYLYGACQACGPYGA
jgi:ATP-dependent DNA ligase